MSESSSSLEANLSFQDKFADHLMKFRDLKTKAHEARKLNFQAVLEEEKRNKLPPNWEAKKRKAEWILNDEKQREDAEKMGEDYDRLKMLNVTAIEAGIQLKRKNKKNPDQGFSDYEQATVRQYNRLISHFEPNMEEYNKEKEKLGGAFYGDKNTILQGLRKDSKEGIDRMVEDLEKQIEKRHKYSRRRAYNADGDINFINERNMKFNKKLERFYGEHTREIKQNLERGTAI